MDDYAVNDLGMAVPKPRPYVSAREAFLYLVLFILLGVVAWNLGSLLFILIDRAECDAQVGQAVKNTLWIIAIMVPLQVLFAFGVATMLARARRGVGFFRTIFYLPALAPPVAATLAFVYILNPATGPVNIMLQHLGIDGPLWFQSPGGPSRH